MDVAESLNKQIRLDILMKEFIDNLMTKGYTECHVCEALQKTASMLHFIYCVRHYPGITDQGKIKTFEDCAGEHCRNYRRSLRRI